MTMIWAIDAKCQSVEDIFVGSNAVVEMGESQGVENLTCLGEIDEGFGSFSIVFPDLIWARCDKGLFVGEVRQRLSLTVAAQQLAYFVNDLWRKRKQSHGDDCECTARRRVLENRSGER
jgi:hypothetical protein